MKTRQRSEKKANLSKYIRILRLDHWIKQLFIVPGLVAAVLLTRTTLSMGLLFRFCAGFAAACLIASANYVINEWLDAEFDKYHPTKKYRTAVTEGVSGKAVWLIWGCLSVFGFAISLLVNIPFLLMSISLWLMGLLYNVKPVRTKDVPILDVLSESVNNAIRLLWGWFAASGSTLPPSSLSLGFWMAGAYLMATKRFSEYRMINDKTVAERYRKSFKYYSEKSLLLTSFFYAMSSVFFLGVFLIKYRIELVLLMPILIGLYSYYFYLSFARDSAVQKPEKLFREKGLMLYCLIVITVFAILMIVDIPLLSVLADNTILSVPGVK